MRSLYLTLRQVLRILPGKAERFYVRFVVFSSLLALLDIVSMGIIALVMSPALTGTPVRLPVIGTIPVSSTPWLIALACGLIMLKGGSTVLMQWWATRRLAVYELEIGDRLFGAYTQLTWEERSRRKTSDITRVADTGIANTIMGFLIPLSSIPPNVVSFLSVAIVLLVAQPLSALAVMAYLIGVALLMSMVLSKKVAQAGRVNRTFAYRAAGVLTELVEALKEFTLRDRLGAVRQHVREIRVHAARARANISFLTIVPRYAMESALMVGLLIVGGVALATSGFQQAIVAIALFTITGFRMLPAINTVQGSLSQASANEIHAKNVVADIVSAETAVSEAELADTMTLPARPRELVLADVGFRYTSGGAEVLHDVDLRIPFGSSLGIAGPTGAGKSTLVDILLGLSSPTSGTVTVDGVPIDAARRSWRGRVAYVPQSVGIFSATIAQNVALTWGDDYDPDRVRHALHRAQLDDVVNARAEGIDAMLTERGSNLSGGQRQRLGIARALYSDPLVLVLDEATSALDGRTEEAVADAIRALEGDVTVIAVAHRLATIRHFDTIAYLDGGRVVATGSFDDLQRIVPDFREQARLAGLEVAGA